MSQSDPYHFQSRLRCQITPKMVKDMAAQLGVRANPDLYWYSLPGNPRKNRDAEPFEGNTLGNLGRCFVSTWPQVCAALLAGSRMGGISGFCFGMLWQNWESLSNIKSSKQLHSLSILLFYTRHTTVEAPMMWSGHVLVDSYCHFQVRAWDDFPYDKWSCTYLQTQHYYTTLHTILCHLLYYVLCYIWYCVLYFILYYTWYYIFSYIFPCVSCCKVYDTLYNVAYFIFHYIFFYTL